MSNFTHLTLSEIKARHDDQFVEDFDAGPVWDDESETSVRALDVLVWDEEADAENDDGANAVARYLVRANA